MILKVFETPMQNPTGKGWVLNDYPILRILHPTEMIIEDPSYYYMTIEDRKYVEEQSRLVGDIKIRRPEDGEDR